MWKSASNEMQGRGHARLNTPCQDKTLCLSKNGINIVALADGAGSAALSHFGAETVVNCISNYIASCFYSIMNNNDGKEIKNEIINVILNALIAKSNDLNCNIRDLASTLLLVATDDSRFMIIHIGDGVIGYVKNDEVKVASAPNNGEFSNETVFVTSPDALLSMKLYRGETHNISGFILMSDGTEQSLYNKKEKELTQAVKKIINMTILLNNSAMNNQLYFSLKNVLIKNTMDDCSIAVLAKSESISSTLKEISFSEQCSLFRLDCECRKSQKQVQKYLSIIEFLKEKKSAKELSRHFHVKIKYTVIRLKYLEKLGLITKEGLYYYSIK